MGSPGFRGTLYYESPAPARRDAPRLLLITFTFPPDPLVGGVRWQEMARHLTHAGWGVDVITRDFSDAADIDLKRLDRLDKGVRIFSVRSEDPIAAKMQRRLGHLLRRYFK